MSNTVATANDTIYHYTTSSGLLGIIKPTENKLKLWFTDYHCLNDKTEGEEILNVYETTIADMKQKNKISEDVYEFLKNIKPPSKIMFTYTVENELKLSYEEMDAYICCFCKVNDSLDMWRYYSKTDIGYSIGLKRHQTQYLTRTIKFESSPQKLCKVAWYDVIYSDKEKSKYIKDNIQSLLDNPEKFEYPEDFTSIKIQSMLGDARFIFKNQCFEHEQEYRCVLYLPKDNSRIDERKSTYDVEYRTSNGIIIPYVTVELDAKALASITAGPTAPPYAIESVKKFLRNRSNVEINQSKLPIRF